ncbi:MAG TPA: hypothetical protein VGQ44_15365 [Gemmatimonadaceae bacterium]|nr:hypothetical protein [Gemmatimonadaceae bacterium]
MTSIAPWLSVPDAGAALRFYTAAFGAVESERLEDAGIVVVGDPDQLFGRAVAGGANAVASMHNAHGWRTGRVADPFGHHWEFAKPLE